MTWNLPSLSICVRIVPRPSASVAEPVLVSTMSAFCLSALGCATTWLETNCCLRILNALSASAGSDFDVALPIFALGCWIVESCSRIQSWCLLFDPPDGCRCGQPPSWSWRRWVCLCFPTRLWELDFLFGQLFQVETMADQRCRTIFALLLRHH